MNETTHCFFTLIKCALRLIVSKQWEVREIRQAILIEYFTETKQNDNDSDKSVRVRDCAIVFLTRISPLPFHIEIFHGTWTRLWNRNPGDNSAISKLSLIFTIKLLQCELWSSNEGMSLYRTCNLQPLRNKLSFHRPHIKSIQMNKQKL